MERGENFEEPEEIEKMPVEAVESNIEPKQNNPESEETPEMIEGEILGLEREINQLYDNEAGVDKLQVEPEKNTDDTSNLTEKEVSGVGITKKLGILIGKSLSWLPDLLKSRVDGFGIECSGTENLEGLEGKPYILAANHIKPENILSQAIGLSPDSFIIKRVIQGETQQTPNAIANVSGKLGRIPVLGLLDRLWSPVREGIMEGMGFIPIKMRRGEKPAGFNRNFVKKFRGAVGRKEPIIIFPQGHWDRDFNPDREFETGAATLARNYELPIVPVFISGGSSWSSKEKASVSFGQVIDSTDMTKEEITDEIKKSIVHLGEVEKENE